MVLKNIRKCPLSSSVQRHYLLLCTNFSKIKCGFISFHFTITNLIYRHLSVDGQCGKESWHCLHFIIKQFICSITHSVIEFLLLYTLATPNILYNQWFYIIFISRGSV